MKACKNSTPITFSRRPIADSRNPAITEMVRLLEHREARTQTGLFYTEGLRFVHQALESRFAPVETLVVCPALLAQPLGNHLLQTVRQRGIPIVEVTPVVFRVLTRVDEPQGIGAVLRQRWESLQQISPSEGLCWLALDTIRSPGNLGTILRTLEAVGGAGIILIGNRIDPFAPEVVRATMGALFRLRFVRTDWENLRQWCLAKQVTLVGTSPHASTVYTQLAYPKRLLLWLGSERKGLSSEQMQNCHRMVRIPMAGQSDSLNVAIASAVMLYEIYNQRQRAETPCQLIPPP
jgi:TrmH family RNA methyltransferase